MSLTIVGRPDTFSPVYNPMFFYIDSSNKNEEGFKYVIDIYSGNTQDTKLGRYKLFPRPNDGFGVADINQLLTSQVGYDVHQNNNIITGATNSFIDYNIVYGEEYVKYWPFYDNAYYGSAPYVGYTMFYSNNGTTHNFVAGDKVLVQQDDGYYTSFYNGTFTVLSASTTAIIVDLPHSYTTPANGGTAVYSDRHKTLDMCSTVTILTGSSVVSNGTFTSSTGWTQNTAITANGTEAKIVPGFNFYSVRLESVDGSVNYTLYNTGYTSSLIAGQKYIIEYDILVSTGPIIGLTFTHQVRSNVGGTLGNYNTSTGTTVEVVTAGTGTTFGIEVSIVADSVPSTTYYAVFLDNVSVKPYTASTTYCNVSSGYTAFNGAISHQDFISYTSSTYNFRTGSTASFLTDMPDGYRVKPSNKMWLNYYSSSPQQNTYLAYLTTRYGEYALINPVTGNTKVQTIACGPANITAVEGTTGSTVLLNWSNEIGTYPIFKDACWEFDQVTSGTMVYSGQSTALLTNLDNIESPWYNNYNDELVDFYVNGVLTQANIYDTPAPNQVILYFPYTGFTNHSNNIYQKTESYDIHFIKSGSTSATSEVRTFAVDYTTTRYGNIELYFVDRLGSLVPVNFELQSAKSIQISRNEYQTFLGNLSGSKWAYDSTDRGRNILNTTVKKQVDLNSNWLTEAEAEYLQQLYTSPAVYIKEYGQLWPVIVTSNSYDIKTKLNKKNIQIKLTIEYANNDRIQNF